MADEPVGKPEESTAPEQPVEATEPEQTEQAEPTGADEGGQPQEGDIRQILEEQKQALSEVMQELRQAKHDATYYRTLVEGREKPPEPEVPKEPPVSNDDFWKDPLGAIRKEFDSREKRRQAEAEQKQRAELARKYQSSFQSGMTAATSKTPGLYKGIENEVAEYVRNTALAANIPPEELAKPEVWDTAAAILRISKGEWDLGKYVKSTPKPVSSVSSEKPGPAVPPKPKGVLSEAERAYMKQWDLTEEQYLSTKKKIAEEG